MPHDAESIALPCRASNRFYAHQLLPCRGLSQPFRCPTAVVAVSLATRPQPGSDLREVAKRQRAGLCPDCRPTTRNSKWPPALSLETCFGLRASTQQFRGSSHVKPCQHPGTLTIQLERRAELFWLPQSILSSPDLPLGVCALSLRERCVQASRRNFSRLFGSSYPANRKPKGILSRPQQFDCEIPEWEQQT